MRRRITDNIDVVTAAYLITQKVKQTEIAKILGVSHAVVSRLLDAGEGKYFKKELRFIRKHVNRQLMQEVLHRSGTKELSDALAALSKRSSGGREPILRVFPNETMADEGTYRVRKSCSLLYSPPSAAIQQLWSDLGRNALVRLQRAAYIGLSRTMEKRQYRIRATQRCSLGK
jgi:predicted transcriptional regulator